MRGYIALFGLCIYMATHRWILHIQREKTLLLDIVFFCRVIEKYGEAMRDETDHVMLRKIRAEPAAELGFSSSALSHRNQVEKRLNKISKRDKELKKTIEIINKPHFLSGTYFE